MDSIKLIEGFAAFITLFIIYHVWPKKKEETRCRPPEPGGAWPIVGHLGLVSGTTALHRNLAALSKTHGSLFTLRLGQMRAFVVSSMDLAKECFTINDRAFASRPPLQSWKWLGYNYSIFGLAPYGSYWREVRKITTLELLSNRRHELLNHISVEEVGSLVRGLYHSCGGNHPVDMNRRLNGLSMNIILRMVAGKRYFSLDGEDQHDGEAEEFKTVISEFFHLLGVFTVGDVIPWLEWLDVGGHIKAMKRVKKKMEGIASAWVGEHRREGESRNREEAKKDFMDVLIKEAEDGHLSEEHQTDTVIQATAVALVAAGTDTTSVTLEWTLAALLNNRQVLQKAQEELDCQIGRERQAEECDIKNLPYLQAIVKESMRLYPAGPLLMPHQSMETIQHQGM